VDNIRNTVKLRDDANPDLKIIISIGGPAQSLQSMTEMAQDAGRRQSFIESTMEYLQRFNLDGVDLYWAYPSAQDKPNFVQVLKVD
jgi:chitinase